jgi:hypothetical protein
MTVRRYRHRRLQEEDHLDKVLTLTGGQPVDSMLIASIFATISSGQGVIV